MRTKKLLPEVRNLDSLRNYLDLVSDLPEVALKWSLKVNKRNRKSDKMMMMMMMMMIRVLLMKINEKKRRDGFDHCCLLDTRRNRLKIRITLEVILVVGRCCVVQRRCKTWMRSSSENYKKNKRK